jgi:hypothetical protein
MRTIARNTAVALAAALGWIGSAAAQDTLVAGPWKYGTTVGLNLSQSSFSSNWSGGDQGSIVWVLNSDLSAQRQISRAFNLSNLLQLAYGQTAQQVPDPADPSRRVWDTPDKTTDLIVFESIGRFPLQTFVDPYLAFRLDSQFEDQSSPIGIIRFNPIKLKESAGISRVLVKTANREAVTRLGFGFRQTLAQSFVDPVTAEKQRFTSNDGGIEWQTTATQPVLDGRVLYKGSLLVFQPVFYSRSDALEDFDALAIAGQPGREAVADFWKASDINFLNTFTAQITTHLSVNLFVQWVYDKFDSAANVDTSLPLAVLTAEVDKNVRKAGQFKETLAIGLSYRLF